MPTSSPACHSFTNPYHSRFQPYCSIRISPVRIPVVTCGELHPHSILHHLSLRITLPTETPSQGPTGTSFKILLPHGPVPWAPSLGFPSPPHHARGPLLLPPSSSTYNYSLSYHHMSNKHLRLNLAKRNSLSFPLLILEVACAKLSRYPWFLHHSLHPIPPHLLLAPS